MKKGFTLVELLGVIVLLGILAIVATPPILNQLRKTKVELSKATLQVLSVETEQFIDDHLTNYPVKDGNVYCIPLKTLVEYDYVKTPVMDASSGEEIDINNNTMKVKMVGIKKDISFVKNSECIEKTE